MYTSRQMNRHNQKWNIVALKYFLFSLALLVLFVNTSSPCRWIQYKIYHKRISHHAQNPLPSLPTTHSRWFSTIRLSTQATPKEIAGNNSIKCFTIIFQTTIPNQTNSHQTTSQNQTNTTKITLQTQSHRHRSWQSASLHVRQLRQHFHV